ncbi:centrosomal protein of 164 kDa-like isoform X3 [Entelurus aequoreus]|uniref:centrosomal protein of 164 kDa-like isoform X3 n=2 Tax=Entelurus aequoreus TaxID=161455 RepID=UPI002B1D718D|nr:centrosomal protein of 164 kDa-like isoform X3 [Entelurus aequoreus]
MYALLHALIMASSPMVIGNQLILEEDFDENYNPSEQEINKYAKEIGIDPDKEEELMWLAKEGIVAPLPPEWKPCQDVTGDIYYYNFSFGESTWDHPCDQHYRRLVIQERERVQRAAVGSGNKKKKKEKKEKKEKNKKDSVRPTGGQRTLALASLQSPRGCLVPLSGLDAPVLGPISGSGSASVFSRSLGSGGLEPLKAPGLLGGLCSSAFSSVSSNKNEEKVFLTMPGFDEGDDILEHESSQRSSDRQIMNHHLDLDDFRKGVQYEESEASAAARAKDRTLSGGHNSEPPSRQNSEASDIMKSSSSTNVKLSENVLDLNDTSSSVSLLEKNYDRDNVMDAMGKYTKVEAVKRNLLSTDKEELTVSKGEELVVPQTLSSHTEVDLLNQPAAERLCSADNLQRPETSRGRLCRTSNIQMKTLEISRCNYVQTLEKESNFAIWKNEEGESEVENEWVRTEKEKNLKVRNKDEELKSGDASQKGDEDTDQLIKEKKKSSIFLQEALFSKENECLKEERGISRFCKELKREEDAEKEQFIREKRTALFQEEEVKLEEEGVEKLREESEMMLKDLRMSLGEEKKLEAQQRLDIERMKAESEEKLPAETTKVHEENRNYFKQEVITSERTCRELIRPHPEQQLTQYHKELSDLLLEVREDVQREHEKKLVHLRQEHRREINNIREKQQEEERVQREQLFGTLQEDRELLQASHDHQLEKLRIQLHNEIEKAQLTYSHKQSELQHYIYQLELKTKDLKRDEEILQSKAEDLNRKRKMLGGEEEDVDLQTTTLQKVILERDQLRLEIERMREDQNQELLNKMREERNKAEQEMERLREEIDKVMEESEKVKEEKQRLESKVALHQEQCERLSRRVSELETHEGQSAFRRKKKSTSLSNGQAASARHGDELEETISSAAPDSCSDMLQFNSSHGSALQRTRTLLEKESHQLMERQTTLHVAQSNYTPQPNQGGGRTEQKKMRRLSELSQMIISEIPLKSEPLKHDDSSIAQKSLLQDAGQRKVTFNVTEDSDLSSTVDPSNETGGNLTFLAKVQELAESQQQISGQLNTVLGALGSLAQRHSSTSLPAFTTVLSPSTATRSSPFLPQVPVLGPISLEQPKPLWKASNIAGFGLANFVASSSTAGLRTFGDVAHRRWTDFFPEGAEIQSSISSLHVQKTVKVDGQKLQKLIESNKRWLEMRKKDTSIPLLTRYRPSSSSQNNLVQLGLDDNNQIKVYHY